MTINDKSKLVLFIVISLIIKNIIRQIAVYSKLVFQAVEKNREITVSPNEFNRIFPA